MYFFDALSPLSPEAVARTLETTEVSPITPSMAVMVAGCFFLFVLLLIPFLTAKLERNEHRAITRLKNAPPSSAVIGYKQALFRGVHDRHPFNGVTGIPYDVKDACLSDEPGFHMFSDLWQAENHIQKGNVLLEVSGYGIVRQHELGYRTTKQRVLQILVGCCEGNVEDCDQPAVGWHEWAQQWLCDYHRTAYTGFVRKWKSFADVERALEKSSGVRVAVRSVAEAAEPEPGLLPWLMRSRLARRLSLVTDPIPPYVPIQQIMAEQKASA